MKEKILSQIETREPMICIIGLGYVGLPLTLEFVKAGYSVIGIDIDHKKIESLEQGKSYITDVDDNDIRSAISSKRFHATTDYKRLEDADVVIITVPTPLSKTRDPDISYVMSATEQIKKHLKQGQLIILESTTFPGTTEDLIKPSLEETGLRVGRDIFLAFSPERINPGDLSYGIRNTPKVVGGVDPDSTLIASTLYKQVVERVVSVSSAKVAEMVKLLENTFRSVNIALVNEIAIACNILGINTWEVIEAAGTKPFGFMKFYPGPGIGGHCIPIDPHYLAWKLKTLNYNARFIELASEINTYMPRYVVSRIQDVLNSMAKPIKGTKILIMGVAYKRDINDVRESPALDIIELLEDKGAMVSYHDPYVPKLMVGNKEYYSINYSNASVKNYDLAVIVTDHRKVDYNIILEADIPIFDTRNVMGKRVGSKIFLL